MRVIRVTESGISGRPLSARNKGAEKEQECTSKTSRESYECHNGSQLIRNEVQPILLL